MPNQIVPNEAWLKRNAIALSSTGGLGLAAAPTFAVMALLTWLRGGDMPDMLCAAVHGSSLLGGMIPMYLLMSAFHLTPWLRLVANRRSSAHGRRSGVRQIARFQAFP
ncbi:MAG TPA: hypothetical protein VGR79_04745 [Stellaceae bacterium]|nr:hypothetical protein [Stellaceae bacterium]